MVALTHGYRLQNPLKIFVKLSEKLFQSVILQISLLYTCVVLCDSPTLSIIFRVGVEFLVAGRFHQLQLLCIFWSSSILWSLI